MSSVISEDQEPHIVDVFQSYVKPVINPKLSEFCKVLTGIEQDVVDKSDIFSIVLKKFEAWMLKHGLGTEKSYVIITDGPFDMGRFMYLQCQQSGKYRQIIYKSNDFKSPYTLFCQLFRLF